jgi:PAS domain-containing protein
VFFRNVGASAESLDLYVAHYAETSPRAAHGKDKPEGFVSYDHQVLSEAEIERNEFYADFLKPQGYKYFVASNLLNNEDLFSVFSVQRHLGQDHVDSEEVALMERLTPHMSQALKIHLRVMGLEGRDRLSAPLSENSATGAIVLNADGTVLRFNPAAERMITDPANGLDITGQRISFTADTQRSAAERLIADALATATGEGHRPARALALPRPDGLPLTMIGIPLPHGPETSGPLLTLTGVPRPRPRKASATTTSPSRATIRLFSRSSERACATARSRRESSNPGLACTAGPAIRHSTRNAGTKTPARHRIPVIKCKKACLLHVLGEVRLGLGAGVEESGDLHAFIEDCLGLRIGIDGNLE